MGLPFKTGDRPSFTGIFLPVFRATRLQLPSSPISFLHLIGAQPLASAH